MITDHLNLIKDKIKITYFLIIMILISSQIAIADTTTPITTGDPIINTIIQENIKTRADIKQYCDQKIDYMISTVKTDGQKIVDANFLQLYKDVNSMIKKALIRASIQLFVVLLGTLMIYYIIARIVSRKRLSKSTRLRYDNLDTKNTGYTQKKMGGQENNNQKEKTDNTTTGQTANELPSFPEITQQPIISSRERERIIIEKEKRDKRRLNELLKEHNKIITKENKIIKKIKKPEEEKELLKKEHDRLQSEIDEIAGKYNLDIDNHKTK